MAHNSRLQSIEGEIKDNTHTLETTHQIKSIVKSI